MKTDPIYKMKNYKEKRIMEENKIDHEKEDISTECIVKGEIT
jgi:hypothetical protein